MRTVRPTRIRRPTWVGFALLGVGLASCTRAPGPAEEIATAAPARAPAPPRADAAPAAALEAAAAAPLALRRAQLFAEPARSALRLSPDGAHIAFIAPHEGVPNLFVAPFDDPAAARPLTRERGRGVRRFAFAYTGQHLVYLRDEQGDERFHLHAVELRTGASRDLTPVAGATAELVLASPRVPGELLVRLNDVDPRRRPLYRVNVSTGARALAQADEGYARFVPDLLYRVRLAERALPDGGVELVEPAMPGGPRSFLLLDPAAAARTAIVGFDGSGRGLLLFDARERATSALSALDVGTRRSRTLAEDPDADVSTALLSPREARADAAASAHRVKRWHSIDPLVRKDLELLHDAADGEIEILGRSLDDRRWVAAFLRSTGPTRFFRYERALGLAEQLFSSAPALDRLRFAPKRPLLVRAGDRERVVRLTLPRGSDPEGRGRPASPLPTVILVGGAPRGLGDRFDPTHQLLADRGYAVMELEHSAAAPPERRLPAVERDRLSADLLEVARFAVSSGIAAAGRVALLGRGQGPAVAAALERGEGAVACAVDGPVEIDPGALGPLAPPVLARLDDALAARSEPPIAPVASSLPEVSRPLLVVRGERDPFTDRAALETRMRELELRGAPVGFVTYPDEGRSLGRAANQRSYHAAVELFLAGCVGGAREPLGMDLDGSSVVVRAGGARMPGLPGPPASTP